MSATTGSIPREAARQLCDTIRAENQRKWYTPGGMMCRGCLRFSKGDPARLCFANSPDNRGCYQITARYDKLVESGR